MRETAVEAGWAESVEGLAVVAVGNCEAADVLAEIAACGFSSGRAGAIWFVSVLSLGWLRVSVRAWAVVCVGVVGVSRGVSTAVLVAVGCADCRSKVDRRRRQQATDQQRSHSASVTRV